MVIPLLIIFVLLVIIVLRMEFLMADFSRLNAAVGELTVEVDAAIAALQAGAEDPAVQRSIDDATASVRAQSDKLLAALPPTPST